MRRFAFRYCIQCGGRLHTRKDARGATRLLCRDCRAVEYQNPKPTVGLLLVCRRELLLVRRARAPFQGWWDLPGGFVERGESLEEALAREVEEEIGVRMKGFVFSGSAADVYAAGEPTLGVYFTKRITSKPDTRAADDVDETRWFSFLALPSRIAFAGQRRVIAHFLRSV